MRATLDSLARFGDGLRILATAVEGLAERLRLRLWLRLRGTGLGLRLLTDLWASEKQPEKHSDALLPRCCRGDLSATHHLGAQMLSICLVSLQLMLSPGGQH